MAAAKPYDGGDLVGGEGTGREGNDSEVDNRLGSMNFVQPLRPWSPAHVAAAALARAMVAYLTQGHRFASPFDGME